MLISLQSLDTVVSPLSMPMLCKTLHAVMYTMAWSGELLIPKWRSWNFLFRSPNVCSMRTLVLQRLALNLSSAGVCVVKNWVIKCFERGQPESLKKDHWEFLQNNEQIYQLGHNVIYWRSCFLTTPFTWNIILGQNELRKGNPIPKTNKSLTAWVSEFLHCAYILCISTCSISFPTPSHFRFYKGSWKKNN